MTPGTVFDETGPVNVFCDRPKERVHDFAIALIHNLSQTESKDERACRAELEAHGSHFIGEQPVIV